MIYGIFMGYLWEGRGREGKEGEGRGRKGKEGEGRGD